MSTEFQQRISYQQAIEIIQRVGNAHSGKVERTALANASSRVLAEQQLARINLPSFDNSAMDGFAVKHEALQQGIRQFEEIGQQWAGSTDSFAAELNSCVRITTGAPIPVGFDTIIIKENTAENGTQITLLDEAPVPNKHSHVRFVGEDMRAGSLLIEANKRLTPLEISLAATQGIADLPCYAKPTVALLTTGDEIIPPGQTLQPGQVYDSNRSLLQSMLREQQLESVAWPIVRDCPSALMSALKDLSESFDLIITCGGVSAGERDYLPELLQQHGGIHFWKVRIKPGMPVLFGRMNQSLIMSLPGNPVSVFATFSALVIPLIRAMQQLSATLQWHSAKLVTGFSKKHSRIEFMRGSAYVDEAGQWCVHADMATGSHRIAAAASNNVFIMLPEGETDFVAGQSVNIRSFGFDSYGA